MINTRLHLPSVWQPTKLWKRKRKRKKKQKTKKKNSISCFKQYWTSEAKGSCIVSSWVRFRFSLVPKKEESNIQNLNISSFPTFFHQPSIKHPNHNLKRILFTKKEKIHIFFPGKENTQIFFFFFSQIKENPV